MSDAFVYRLRVRFCECDPQRVVFNAVYAMYIDLAVLEFMRALGLGDTLVKGPLDYQLVRQSLEWKAPARFDQVVEIAVSAGRLGTTSFTMLTEFRIGGESGVIATGETVYVLVDAATLTKTPKYTSGMKFEIVSTLKPTIKATFAKIKARPTSPCVC